MLSFQPSQLTASSISKLKPGAVFTFREIGEYHLAALLEVHNNSFLFLPLTGKGKFKFQMIDITQSDLKVVVFPFAANDLRIRVDHHSGMPTTERELGRLIVSPEYGLCISAVWPGHEEDYCNAVQLSDWGQVTVDTARFAFRDWTLSYLDESKSWVDVVTSS